MPDNNSEIIRQANRTLEKISQNSEKLLKEVSRLRRDVARLFKFLHINDEQMIDAEPTPKRTINLQETLADIETARQVIRNIEFDILHIETFLRRIENGEASGAELSSRLAQIRHEFDP